MIGRTLLIGVLALGLAACAPNMSPVAPVVGGGAVAVADPADEGRDILCTVPQLPAGKNFVLPMRGSRLSVVATYKRASGHTYRSQVHQ